MSPTRLVFAGVLALALGAPVVEAAPSKGRQAQASRGKQSRTNKPRMRRGVPVLRSRVTPGRTRKIDREAPTGPSGTVADPPATAPPAAHIELSIDGMRQGNAALDFEGRVRASVGAIETNVLGIAYPMAGAEGRELTLECKGKFHNDVTVSTRALSKSVSQGQTIVYDEFIIKEKSNGKPRNSIKLFIDTTVPPEHVDSHTFRVVIKAFPTPPPNGGGNGPTNHVPGYVKPMGMMVDSCTLDLAEP